MDTVQVYRNAITYVQNLGKLPWTQTAQRSADATLAGTDVVLHIESFTTARSKLKFQVGHVILGIYNAIGVLAEVSGFCVTNTTIYIGDQMLGRILITKQVSSVLQLPSASDRASNNSETPNAIPTNLISSSSSSLSARSLQITDPTDPSFKLTYDFDGPGMKKEDILAAALDGMVKIARFPPTDNATDLHAYSYSGKCIIYFTPFEEGAPVPMSYASLRQALRLIWNDVMWMQSTWGEISFTMFRNEVHFALGFVTRYDV